MCVICASPTGVRQPTRSEIMAMFLRNPDGAGYMVARDGKVTIHKGFMNLDEFLNVLRKEHFTKWISTQAGVSSTMTHPFPLSNQLARMEKLDTTCRFGIAATASSG